MAGSIRDLKVWQEAVGLAAETVRSARQGARRETKVVTHLRYPRCANGLAVEHLRLADVDHGWPDKNWGLDTNTAVLSFFARLLWGQTP